MYLFITLIIKIIQLYFELNFYLETVGSNFIHFQ